MTYISDDWLKANVDDIVCADVLIQLITMEIMQKQKQNVCWFALFC